MSEDRSEPVVTVVVEDDPPTRRYVCEAIATAPGLLLAGDAGTVADGAALIEAHEPGLLVTDLGLPDGHGLDLIGKCRRELPHTQIMVMTVFGDEKTVIAALEAGAGGYLLKDSPPEQLVAGLDELLAGGAPLSPAVARFLLRRLRPDPAPPVSDEVPSLTDREREVLELAAKGFSFKEVADLLECSIHTVKTHVRHIYRKLEVSSRGEAVYEAVAMGIIARR